MNIALFTDSYYPQINGVATSVRMLKQELEARGHTVYVFTTTDPLANRRAEVKEGIFRLRSIPMMSDRRLGLLPSPRMIRFITRLKIDIVHTHTEFSLGLLGRSVAWYFNLPLVHTYHTIYEYYTHFIVKAGFLDSVAKRMFRNASATVCNQAEAVVVPTGKVQQLLRTYGVYRPIHVIPTGIKTERFHWDETTAAGREQLRTELGYRPGDRVLLYLGRVSEEKDIDVLIRQLAVPLEQESHTYLLVVGDGSARDGLEYLSRQLGLEKKIQFAGQKPWEEVARYYHACDIFVTASQSETQGLTYIEALASGLPVLAKEDRCLDGVVINGLNGWQWKTADELAAALAKLPPGSEALTGMRQAAMESAENFTAAGFARKMEELYRQVISQGRQYERIRQHTMKHIS